MHARLAWQGLAGPGRTTGYMRAACHAAADGCCTAWVRAAGASDLAELKAHALFAGVDWEGLRRGPAPAYVAKPRRPADEEALDWELTSLVAAAAGAAYQLEPQ